MNRDGNCDTCQKAAAVAEWAARLDRLLLFFLLSPLHHGHSEASRAVLLLM